MPELPEVESVRSVLARHIPGRRIVAVQGEPVKLRRGVDPAELAGQVVGRTFAEPERQAKFLLLPFTEGGRLMIHLGMTGRVTVHAAPDEPLAPHTHVRFDLDDGRQLRFTDARRFGCVVWLPPGESDPSIDKLGLDPLADDFVDQVVPLWKSRQSPIKNVLMDQSVVGGLGNIYVAEALFRAGIHPSRRAGRISAGRLEKLARACQTVLREAIAAGGTTLRDYANPEGREGWFEVDLQVYGREGQPCHVCGTELVAMVMQARTTVYCPTCQR